MNLSKGFLGVSVLLMSSGAFAISPTHCREAAKIRIVCPIKTMSEQWSGSLELESRCGENAILYPSYFAFQANHFGYTRHYSVFRTGKLKDEDYKTSIETFSRK